MELGLYTFAELTPDPVTGRAISPAQRLRNLIEEATLADEVGLDVFGVGEHHRPDFAVSAPAVALAAAAERRRDRLTSAVSVLSSDEPERVYEQFGTLDRLSADGPRSWPGAARSSRTADLAEYGREKARPEPVDCRLGHDTGPGRVGAAARSNVVRLARDRRRRALPHSRTAARAARRRPRRCLLRPAGARRRGRRGSAGRARGARRPGGCARRGRRARGELEPQRRGWLGDQVRGLRVYAGVLAGEGISYADEVEGCYGVRPEPVSEDDYRGAHEQLDELLPGDGSLLERYEGWRSGLAVPAERMIPALVALVDAAAAPHRRGCSIFPTGEELVAEEVRDEPWWAFNYYLGDLRSRVVVNADTLTTAVRSRHARRSRGVPGPPHRARGQGAAPDPRPGRLEEAIQLVPTPQALVSEGIAEIGPRDSCSTRSSSGSSSDVLARARARGRPRAVARDRPGATEPLAASASMRR